MDTLLDFQPQGSLNNYCNLFYIITMLLRRLFFDTAAMILDLFAALNYLTLEHPFDTTVSALTFKVDTCSFIDAEQMDT